MYLWRMTRALNSELAPDFSRAPFFPPTRQAVEVGSCCSFLNETRS